MVLRLLYWRELDLLGAEWQGWKLGEGSLISPDGWEVNRNHALSVPLMESYIQALRSQVANLEATRDALEEQPLPEDAIPQIVG